MAVPNVYTLLAPGTMLPVNVVAAGPNTTVFAVPFTETKTLLPALIILTLLLPLLILSTVVIMPESNAPLPKM